MMNDDEFIHHCLTEHSMSAGTKVQVELRKKNPEVIQNLRVGHLELHNRLHCKHSHRGEILTNLTRETSMPVIQAKGTNTTPGKFHVAVLQPATADGLPKMWGILCSKQPGYWKDKTEGTFADVTCKHCIRKLKAEWK
jgi:hypothetical protein